jgi:uncharacterized protein DUF5906
MNAPEKVPTIVPEDVEPSAPPTGGNTPQAEAPVAQVTLLKAKNPELYRKGYSVGKNGERVKRSATPFFSGQAVRKGVTLSRLAEVLKGQPLPDVACLMSGVSEAKSKTMGRVAGRRTAKEFPFNTGPSLLCIDSDALDQWPALKTPRDVVMALATLSLKSDCVTSSSASSYLRWPGGASGLRGLHTFYMIDRGTEIPRVLEALHARACLAGHGRIHICSNGVMLARSIIDRALGVSNQPIFEWGAVCGEGVTQERQVQFHGPKDGVYGKPGGSETQIILAASIGPLTGEELARFAEWEKEEKAKHQEEADRVRERWLDGRVAALPDAERLAARQQLLADLEEAHRDLPPWFEVTMAGGSMMTVEGLREACKAQPDKWHKKTLPDPYEPDYRADCATIVCKGQRDGKAKILSMAHGQQVTYHLEPGGSGDAVDFDDLDDEDDGGGGGCLDTVLAELEELQKMKGADAGSRNRWMVRLFELGPIDRDKAIAAAAKAWVTTKSAIKDQLKGIERQGPVAKEYRDGGKEAPPSHRMHAEALVQKLRVKHGPSRVVCDGNAIYRCGEDNLWSEIPRDELVLEASEVAPGAAQCERISDYKAIAQLAGMLLTETEFFKDAPWGFASLSHFYRAEGKVLVKEPLAPEHRQRFKLDFDPEPDCPTPLFDALLKAQANGAEWGRSLAQTEGATLARCFHPQQKAVLHYGETNTGKGVFQRTMERFYGPEDHTEVDIARVGEPNVAVQLLHSRRNVTSETSVKGDPLPDAAFKKMTGGDRIAMKVLYQDAFSGHFHGTAMVISNVFPHTNDRGEAFWRRWLCFRWPHTIAERDRVPELEKRIWTEERAGVLAWILKGLEDFLANGLVIPECHAPLLEEWRNRAEVFTRFLTHPRYVVRGPHESCRQGEAWAAFLAFRLDQGIKADLGRNTFYEGLLLAGARLGISRTRTEVADVMRGFRVTTQGEQEAYDKANGEAGLSRFGKDGGVAPAKPADFTDHSEKPFSPRDML